MLSVVAPWLLLSSARLDEQLDAATSRGERSGYAASAITPLRSLQLCERLTLLPTCNRSPCAQLLRLGRGDRITDVFAQVQHQIATSQISLRALLARKERSPGSYGRLQLQIGAESTVRGLCGRLHWHATLCGQEAIRMHHESST